MTDDPQTECLQPHDRIDGPITLAEPDPAWVRQYARE